MPPPQTYRPPAPPYYPQQPAQRPYYAPYPPSPPAQPVASRTTTNGPLIAGSLVVAAVAVGVIFAVWKFGVMTGNELDVHKTEAAVQQS